MYQEINNSKESTNKIFRDLETRSTIEAFQGWNDRSLSLKGL